MVTLRTTAASTAAFILSFLVAPSCSGPGIAFVATESAYLDAPESLDRLFAAPTNLDESDTNALKTKTLLFNDNFQEGAVFARPNGASKTGIPYTVKSYGEQGEHSVSRPLGKDNPNLGMCFLVQHMGGFQRSCSDPGQPWHTGMLVIERLGSPTITAVLLKRAHPDNAHADENEKKAATSYLLVAWNRFKIRVLAESAAVALVQAPRILRRRQRYTPTLLELHSLPLIDVDSQDGKVANLREHEDAALRYLVSSVVVVNLVRQPALLARMMKLLEHTAPLHYMAQISVYEAVDGRSLDMKELVQAGTLSQEGMDSALRTGVRVEAIELTIGAIGCALSHINIWQKIATSKAAALVLEDDIYFVSRFEAKLREVVHQLPSNFSMLYLSIPDYALRSDPIVTGRSEGTSASNDLGTTVRAVLGDNYGTSAYVLSPEGARSLLQEVLPLSTQIDSHIISVTEQSLKLEAALGGGENLKSSKSRLPFDVYATDPPLVYELKTLHKSDVQVGL